MAHQPMPSVLPARKRLRSLLVHPAPRFSVLAMTGAIRTSSDAGEASPAGAARSNPESKTSVVRKTVMNGSLFTGCCEGSIYGG